MDGQGNAAFAKAGAIPGALISIAAGCAALALYNAYRLHYPGVSGNSVGVVIGIAILASIVAAYLSTLAWRRRGVWPTWTLLLWCLAQCLAPNFLYPNFIPRIILFGCVTLCTMSLRAARKADKGGRHAPYHAK